MGRSAGPIRSHCVCERGPDVPALVHARRITLATLVLVALHCSHLDDDPQPVLVERAGPEAVDCGFADGNAYEPVQPDGVRACAITALRDGQAFYASVSPTSFDGGTIVGWASDGQSLWRLDYDYITGCSPRWKDDLRERPCEVIQDKGDDCRSLWDDLCLSCL